jgi:hypothetical protein
MKNTREELKSFEAALSPLAEAILMLLDGDEETMGAGGDVSVDAFGQHEYRFQKGVRAFLEGQPNLDPGYRMELETFPFLGTTPTTGRRRADELRGYALALIDLIGSEAYSESDQRDYWKIYERNPAPHLHAPRALARTWKQK